MIARVTQPGGRRGFTLIESMATLTVLAVLSSISSFLILEAVDSYNDATTTAQLHGELSIALERAARELRRIDQDDTAPGVAPDILSTLPSWLEWEDTLGRHYQLGQLASDLILEVEGDGATVLLGDVTACTVSTYDEDDTLLPGVLGGAGCDDIRRVRLDVTVTRNDVSESLRTKVFIRSTMQGAQGGP